MNFMKLLVPVLLTISSIASACPAGQYEMCAIPRPWGGCAQKVCVPNGGTLTGGASDAFADLNQGVIHFGNEVVNTSAQVGGSLATTAGKINWAKVDLNVVATAVFIAEFLVNGAACIASDGVSPGYSSGANGGGTIVCSQNACACSALSLAMAIKLRSDMSPEEKQKTEQIVNDPQYGQIMARASTISATTTQLIALGIYRREAARPNPPRCNGPRCIEP